MKTIWNIFKNSSSQHSVVVWVFAVLFMFPANARSQSVEFSSDRWELKDAEVKDYLGRKALAGNAYLKDVTFENGIVEVDIAAEHRRSYPGVVFRVQAEGEYERVYLRPHRAGHYSDAIQYVPAFNGVDGWQLYSGEGFTAPLTLPVNQWVHLRIEVKGTQARVFVGGETQPALVIHDLKHGKSKGKLGLVGPRDGSAYFSNFSYTSTDDLKFDPPPTAEPLAGVITDWLLSQPSQINSFTAERYPDEQTLKAIQWLQAKSEPSGLVDIAKYRKPFPSGTSQVWAKATLHADAKELRPIAFGYSDDVSIYLNGRPIFHGGSGYQRRGPSFLGIVGWNDTVYLPLEKGDNELMLLVWEAFGGWGFMCRDTNAIYQDKRLTKLWELPDKLHVPESVAYDAKRNVLYVSNFGDQFISKVGLNGEVLAFEWAIGVNRPTGMRIWRDKLYVVERPGIAEIDLDTGKVLNRYPVPGAKFLNDLSFDDQGAIYITDSQQDGVYKIVDNKPEFWLHGDAVGEPNGILAEKERLLVGVTKDGTIKSVDYKTKQVTTFVTLGAGANMDGLVTDGKGGFLISDYFGRIYQISPDGQKSLLLNRMGPRQFTADFEYIPEKGLLIVPSLYDNRLTAYSYKPDAN